MSFRLVPKLVTLNDHEQRNGRYFALFQRIRYLSGRTAIYHLWRYSQRITPSEGVKLRNSSVARPYSGRIDLSLLRNYR